MAGSFLRIALAQVMASSPVEAVCAAAASKGADIVVFPEMFSNGYSSFDPGDAGSRQAWLDAAVPLDGDYVAMLRQAASGNGLAVVATFLEQGDPKPFNTALLIDRTGEILLHQRKRHICFFDVPEEACAPGETSSVARLETKAGEVAVGLMICMDREFPDVASDLVREKAELILIPNSCRLIEDSDVGDVRVAGLRGLAFQSATAMAVANYPEPKDDGYSFGVDPLGKILTMGGRGEELVLVDFDLDHVREIQAQEWFRRVS